MKNIDLKDKLIWDIVYESFWKTYVVGTDRNWKICVIEYPKNNNF